MAAQTRQITITASLKSVKQRKDGKYLFSVHDRKDATGLAYKFLLTEAKALKLANEKGQFPKGVNLRLSGRVSKNDKHGLNFVKIHAVDGHDVQSWAERHKSPTVDPNVLSEAQKRIMEAEEEAMRRRAPPEPPPTFKSPQEAYDKAMYLVRRQVRLKDPKITKSEIWAIRDALNMLKEAAGL